MITESMRFTNSGENFWRNAVIPILLAFDVIYAELRGGNMASKPKSGLLAFCIALAPRLLVRKMRQFSKLTVVLSPSRSVALSRIPSSKSRHGRRGLLNLVKQDDRNVRVLARDAIDLRLIQHRLRFPMAEIARRRADEFGDLVLHLEFTAVNLQTDSCCCRATLRPTLRPFAFFPYPLGPQQTTPTGRPSGDKPGLMHVDVRKNRLDGFWLTDEKVAQAPAIRQYLPAGIGRRVRPVRV